jgi:hypothetical protein
MSSPKSDASSTKATRSRVAELVRRALCGDEESAEIVVDMLHKNETDACEAEAKAREADEAADSLQKSVDDFVSDEEITRLSDPGGRNFDRILGAARHGYDGDCDEVADRLESAVERIELETARAVAAELRAEAAEARVRLLERREYERLKANGDSSAAVRMLLGIDEDRENSEAESSLDERFTAASERVSDAETRIEDAETRLWNAKSDYERLGKHRFEYMR